MQARPYDVGDTVRAVAVRGYALTTGKTYTVLEYSDPVHAEGFTWPAYVVVTDDNGKRATCHTHRFAKV